MKQFTEAVHLKKKKRTLCTAGNLGWHLETRLPSPVASCPWSVSWFPAANSGFARWSHECLRCRTTWGVRADRRQGSPRPVQHHDGGHGRMTRPWYSANTDRWRPLPPRENWSIGTGSLWGGSLLPHANSFIENVPLHWVPRIPSMAASNWIHGWRTWPGTQHAGLFPLVCMKMMISAVSMTPIFLLYHSVRPPGAGTRPPCTHHAPFMVCRCEIKGRATNAPFAGMGGEKKIFFCSNQNPFLGLFWKKCFSNVQRQSVPGRFSKFLSTYTMHLSE